MKEFNMYYSDDKYKHIPVPKDKQSDIHLRIYNGKSFVLSKEKQLAFKRQDIYNKLDELSARLVKNNTRYSHHLNKDEYNENIINEIKELESQLNNL